ncbi:hypothetical protein STPYR_11908 [uncultured Stenotrophomonas sp.]|uniref:Uncharacterized protein n=1 Tax=uncultured Stenotrophomonas sp. TaxID=165438 RepID=A0A1Y5Q3U8_9GAMM|nr:hypothetical protein STPYR_11908 [uncultured Stenotrophomonas sp.]
MRGLPRTGPCRERLMQGKPRIYKDLAEAARKSPPAKPAGPGWRGTRDAPVGSGEDLEAGLVFHVALLAEAGLVGAERHLRAQLPVFGNAPLAAHGLVHQRVVMLQAGTDACVGQRRPHRELGDAVGLLGPHREVVGVQRELFLQVVDHVGVDEIQHRAGTGSEAVELGLGGGEGFGRHDLAQRILGQLPELHALRPMQDQRPRGLRIERRRRFAHRALDQVGGLVLADRQVAAQGVLRTTLLVQGNGLAVHVGSGMKAAMGAGRDSMESIVFADKFRTNIK